MGRRPLTEEDRERANEEARERQRLQDLAEVVRSGSGFRVLLDLLDNLCAFRQVSAPVDVELKNAAEVLLDDIARAEPNGFLALMAAGRGIGPLPGWPPRASAVGRAHSASPTDSDSSD